MSHYRIGLATCDITPPVGVYLAGFASRTERSTDVYHPLRATAVAIDDGQTTLLIVMAEWLGFYDRTERMRERLVEATGVDAKNIVLTGTHTHCGPSVRAMDRDRHGEVDEDYVAQAIERMTACATEAWTSRADSVLKYGVGTCGFAVHRRLPDPDNPPRIFRAMKPNRQGPVDHDVPVLTIESPEGELRGVIFGYTCHPTSRGGLLIGGDYPCFAMDKVEAANPGVIACFLQGCAGDQKPHPVDPDGEWFDQREIEQIRDIGEQLGDAVNRVIASGKRDEISGPIAVTQHHMTLQTVPLDEQLVDSLLEDELAYKQAWAQHYRAMLDRGETPSRDVPYELQTIRFGKSLAVVTMAAEMTAEYSLRLKAELGGAFDHVFPVAYANHIIGYVPVKRQIPEEGYEVWDSNMYYKRTGPYVDTTEQQIIDTARQGLKV
jgi:hypothetical protein